MTRPKMLPTPASSTEIKGQDHSAKLCSLHLAFELPPSALPSDEAPKLTTSTKLSPGSPTPMPYLQPSETVKARRRSATAQPKEFALPPPPTRSCKIIQMKPRQQEKAAPTPSPAKGAGAKGAVSKPKKQPSPTSAAGRKIARKTAHSLIERRRRSKMNDEFAVLKGLIPDCTGEMHKLAILQAAIEYVHYLKDCKAKLEVQNSRNAAAATALRATQREYEHAKWQQEEEEGEEADEGGVKEERGQRRKDVEMGPGDSKLPMTSPPGTHSYQSPISPALTAQDILHQPFPQSGIPSPPSKSATITAATTRTTSPMPRPQLDTDHEASAALLMLHAWHQGGNGRNPARGMSVQDLLSS
ncbi:hypothetical protein F4861DRAFT_191537 [Xylaria intraflava]|nr:hypothetical protein F4861DRAFT_191537 [Xylaria intraflava]